jgi:hypothetical protein
MLSDLVHRIIYYSAVLTVIATVWVSAWSRAIVAEADRGYWPPLHPQASYVFHDAAATNTH